MYSPPYENMSTQFDDMPRQILRRAREAIGLPASADVGVLSRILKQLLDFPTLTLGDSPRVNSVVISYTTLYALYQEDIIDAGTYLGVETLYGQYLNQPHNMVAAYAGHGLGLCEDYQDYKACEEENSDMPSRDVLLVEYSEHALLLHVASYVRAAVELLYLTGTCTFPHNLALVVIARLGAKERLKLPRRCCNSYKRSTSTVDLRRRSW